jgi:ABC-type phosphate transport system substrate-binding protein
MIFSIRAMRLLFVIPSVALALASLAGAVAAPELVVIVSARSTAPLMRTDQVAAIFLGQAAQLPDGALVTPIDQPVGTMTRDEFYERVASKSPALLKAYWSKLLFTGRGQPPREVGGNAAVKKMVADTPGIIGYIDRSALDASVRPVLVLH